jgi:hypothetical protein
MMFETKIGGAKFEALSSDGLEHLCALESLGEQFLSFVLRLHDPEDEGTGTLRNVENYSPNIITSHPLMVCVFTVLYFLRFVTD